MKHTFMLKTTLSLMALLLLASCSSLKSGTKLSLDEIDLLKKNSVDPRKYGLTVYPSEHGPYYKPAHRSHPGQFVMLSGKFPKTTKLPVVEFVTRQGHPIIALIDTHARQSWISYDNAANLKVKAADLTNNRIYADHVNDSVESFSGLTWKFELGDMHIENCAINVRTAYKDLGPLKRGIDKPNLNMVLGNEMFDDLSVVQFSWHNKTIILTADEEYKPHRTGFLAYTSMERYKGAIAIEAKIGNYKGYCILDVAGDYEIVVPEHWPKEKTTLRIKNYTLEKLNVKHPHEANLSPSLLPRIGNKVLSQTKLTLDYKRNVVFFEQ